MIKGITPSLAEAHKIKIGKLSDQEYQAKSGRKYRRPVKLDHFIITKTTRVDGQLEVDDSLMEALLKAGFGDKDDQIRSLPILLHSDIIDEVFPTVYACYGGGRLACRGDGEKATRWSFDPKTKKRLDQTREIQCTCELLAADKCKPHGTLNCSIALPGHSVAGALDKFRTTGIISIQRMIGSLQQILSVVGTLRNVPLVLRVQPVDVEPGGKKQTVYSCHIELRAGDILELQQKALEARESLKLLGPPVVEVKALLQAPASDNETEEEQAEVQAEFFPSENNEPPQSTTEAVKQAAQNTVEKKTEAEPPPPADGEIDYGEPDA